MALINHVKDLAKTVTCPICGGLADYAFSHPILKAKQADLYLCPGCDFLFVARPDWLKEAYSRVINLLDTGCLARAESMRAQTALILYLLAGPKGRWLDYGAGHGLYVRRMRDTGLDFHWQDPMAENLFAGGFEDKAGMQYDGLTCFECLEHFTDPQREFQTMASRTSRILFSTDLRPEKVPPPDGWWYYAWEHGQHVGFHSRQSLDFLAKKIGLSLVSDGRAFHAFLPMGEANQPAARLIKWGSLPLSAWAHPALKELFTPKVFFMTLMKKRIFSHDLLGRLQKVLGSKTWPDHLALKSAGQTGG